MTGVISEFVGNTSNSWLSSVQPSVPTTSPNSTPSMAEDPTDYENFDPDMPTDEDHAVAIGVGVGCACVVIIIILIIAFCFYKRRQRKLYKNAIGEHVNFRHTVRDNSVFSVEKEASLEPVTTTSVTSERCLRYSGQPAVSSLPEPLSNRSASYDHLRDGDKAPSWNSLRNSVCSDQGYYGSDTIHLSSSQPNGALQAQAFLDQVDCGPERSLSSDQIQHGRWPPSLGSNGNKAASLGRDSGLGGSQETYLSYQSEYEDSLYSSMSGDTGDQFHVPQRPRSLPRLYPDLHGQEIKKIEDIPIRSLRPSPSPVDENGNQPDVLKHIQYLRDQFYTVRNRPGSRSDADTPRSFRTSNFTIAIFGSKGGNLQLFDKSASLSIPEGALPFDQEVYLYAFYENACIDGKSYLRRVIECGPDGLAFKKPVCLSFLPKLIPCDQTDTAENAELSVVYKNAEPGKWKPLEKEESFSLANPDFVSIHVDHFTRFTVVPTGASADSTPTQPVAAVATRKFYVSVYVGATVSGTTNYRVCFIEKGKDNVANQNSAMNKEGFSPAVAAPKPFSLALHGHDVILDVPSLHGCELKGSHTRYAIPLEEFEADTIDDIGPPQRDFLLGLRKSNSEGLFEIAVLQEKVHDKVLTFCVSMKVNNLKEKLMVEKSAGSADLTHRDVMEFLAGNRLVTYRPNVCFPKSMKLDICTNVENSLTHGWMKLAEAAAIPGNKSKWIETYVRDKHVTPCYVVLDFIEAKLISSHLSIGEACDQLAAILENNGFEVAADFCHSWKRELSKQNNVSPHKEKGSRSYFGRHGDNLSPSREELGTIQEEATLSRHSSGRLTSAYVDNERNISNTNRELHFSTPVMANGAVRSIYNRDNLPDTSSRSNRPSFERGDSNISVMSLPSPATGTPLPSPEHGPYTISAGENCNRYQNRRPNKVLLKANREKSGRNDSGIGSDIASPVESDFDRVSHI